MSEVKDKSVAVLPRYIRVDARDNVAIVVNQGGLPAGSRFADGLVLVEQVPEAHKVALVDMADGEAILRYGVVIGYAKQPIARGSWVHEGLLTPPEAPALSGCPLSTAVPESLPELEGYTFEGFRNKDGSVGTKNILAISTTVQCVAARYGRLCGEAHQGERFCRHVSNVDDVVAIAHHYGCGVAIDAPGAAVPIRTLRNLSRRSELWRRDLHGESGLRKAAADAHDSH